MSERDDHIYGQEYQGGRYPKNFQFFDKDHIPENGELIGRTKEFDPRVASAFLYWIVGPDGIGSVHNLGRRPSE